MNVIQSSGALSNPFNLPLFGYMTDTPDADNRIFVSGIIFDSPASGDTVGPFSVHGFLDADHITNEDKFFTGVWVGNLPQGESIIIKGNDSVFLGAEVTRTDGSKVPFGFGVDVDGNTVGMRAGSKFVNITFDPDGAGGDVIDISGF